ncbi:MAG: DUF302 domain-containing protein [Bacteroidales bacterium]|nr:DUF302 domain-containing protein [Bacteroidales bacterium]
MMKIKIVLFLAVMFAVQSITAQQEQQKYYFSKTLNGTFEEVTARTKSVLKEVGFGVITEIDMDAKLKEKLTDVDLRPYKILGVCNPGYAYQTIQLEENIGLFLPCKVLVKDQGKGQVEVVMVNPSALMSTLGNEELNEVAAKVTEKFRLALEKL